jgi:hypothetical protein
MNEKTMLQVINIQHLRVFYLKKTKKKETGEQLVWKKQINITITNYSTHHATVTTCIVHPIMLGGENKINTHGDSELQITTQQ